MVQDIAHESITPQNLYISDKITTSHKEPFFCFSVSNYLPRKLYLGLCESFPSNEYFVNQTSYAKKSFSSRAQPEIYEKFLKESHSWALFLETLSSPAVIQDIKKTCFTAMRESRGLFPFKYWKQKSSNNIIEKSTLLSRIKKKIHSKH